MLGGPNAPSARPQPSRRSHGKPNRPTRLDFACRSGVRNLAHDLQARTFVHPVMTNERLESSPAANGDGRGSARTADPSGFQPGATHPSPSGMVRLRRIHTGQQGCSWIGHSGWYGAVRLGADQLGRTLAESRPRAYVSGWSRVSLMPPARPASHARRWSSISNRRPLRRASETHCRDAPGLIPLCCSRRCRRTLALGRPHLRPA